MRNKGLIIALIVILSIVVIGLIVLLSLAISGKLNFRPNFRNFGVRSNNIIYDENYNIETIEDI